MEDDYDIDAYSNSSDYDYDTSENGTNCEFPEEEQYLTLMKFNLILGERELVSLSLRVNRIVLFQMGTVTSPCLCSASSPTSSPSVCSPRRASRATSTTS